MIVVVLDGESDRLGVLEREQRETTAISLGVALQLAGDNGAVTGEVEFDRIFLALLGEATDEHFDFLGHREEGKAGRREVRGGVALALGGLSVEGFYIDNAVVDEVFLLRKDALDTLVGLECDEAKTAESLSLMMKFPVDRVDFSESLEIATDILLFDISRDASDEDTIGFVVAADGSAGCDLLKLLVDGRHVHLGRRVGGLLRQG